MYNLCIIGLGNPSPKYDNTRHNIGKDWVINLSKKFFKEFKEKSKLEALIAESHDNKILWVVPTNYMNNSGKTISKVLRSTNIEIQKCIVFHDDLDLNLGSIRLKEGGGHRVQRVPETESQGRVHTSTCTVAVLPEVEEVQDINIDKNDLRVDTFRASGAGGQHVNKTDSAVRLTHIPTGLVVECQDGRSQHKNKEKALSLLAAKLKQQEIDNQQESIASERKILVGTGDRSEKIRTYNFPQGRMTDHRIKLTQHNLDQIMDGDIKEICDALLAENQLAMLSQLESE